MWRRCAAVAALAVSLLARGATSSVGGTRSDSASANRGMPGPFSLVGDGGWQSLDSSGSNHWVATSYNGSVEVNATVPGQIHLDLQAAGIMPETYREFNQERNAWVCTWDAWTTSCGLVSASAHASLVPDHSSCPDLARLS